MGSQSTHRGVMVEDPGTWVIYVQMASQIRAHTQVVIGSGGVRTGMDVAVAIALGADAAAYAAPVLEAAMRSEEDAVRALETMIYELRVICFCTGARTPRDLRQVTLVDARQ